MIQRKMTRQRTIMLSEELDEKLIAAAKELNTKPATIVRECLANDLPKLIKRERKRIISENAER